MTFFVSTGSRCVPRLNSQVFKEKKLWLSTSRWHSSLPTMMSRPILDTVATWTNLLFLLKNICSHCHFWGLSLLLKIALRLPCKLRCVCSRSRHALLLHRSLCKEINLSRVLFVFNLPWNLSLPILRPQFR